MPWVNPLYQLADFFPPYPVSIIWDPVLLFSWYAFLALKFSACFHSAASVFLSPGRIYFVSPHSCHSISWLWPNILTHYLLAPCKGWAVLCLATQVISMRGGRMDFFLFKPLHKPFNVTHLRVPLLSSCEKIFESMITMILPFYYCQHFLMKSLKQLFQKYLQTQDTWEGINSKS